MSQTVYDLSERAKRALVALHEQYKAKASGTAILRPPGYWGRLASEYEAKVQAIIRGSFTEVENDRTVRVRCPYCRHDGQIRGTQTRWTCCGQDHYTFATTVEE